MTIWDPTGLPTIARVLADAPPVGATFSPDGTMLAAVDNEDTVALYRVEDLHLLGSLSVEAAGRAARLTAPHRSRSAPIREHSRSVIGSVPSNSLTRVRSSRWASRSELVKRRLSHLPSPQYGRTLAVTRNANNVNGVFVIDLESREVTALDPPVPFVARGHVPA